MKEKLQNLKDLEIRKGGWFRVENEKDSVLLLYVSERALDHRTKRKAFIKYIQECDDEWLEGTNHYVEVLGGEILTMMVQTSGTGSPNECPPGVNCSPIDPDEE